MADGFIVSRARPRPRVLPTVSFGPYGLLEAVPWLMLASAMRFIAYVKPVLALPALLLASLAIFLAFLLAARRMIELADGSTQLGRLGFQEQVSLAVTILLRVLALLVGAAMLVALAGPSGAAIFMLAGFDGIAFDQFSKLGVAWSTALSAVVLLMVVRAGDGGTITLSGALRELAARWRYLVPAVVVLVALLAGLSEMQGLGRGLIVAFHHSAAPVQVKNLVYFFFVFAFAALRLWMTLAVLVFALRESYRAGPA